MSESSPEFGQLVCIFHVIHCQSHLFAKQIAASVIHGKIRSNPQILMIKSSNAYIILNHPPKIYMYSQMIEMLKSW